MSLIASIRMGEMSVANNGEELHTLLGSCLGLALYDRNQLVAGLAHILLPYAPEETDKPGKFVDTAVPMLIDSMSQLVASDLSLTAKLAGGACMFRHTKTGNIGQQNIESCESVLKNIGIPIVGRHCGGEKGRRMTLNSTNGIVRIEIVGSELVEF